MLAHAHGKGSNTEEVLAKALIELGYGLPAKVEEIDILAGENAYTKHMCICIKSLAEEVARSFPKKLLNGLELANMDAIHGCFRSFWRVYQKHNSLHPVYTDHKARLQWCVPCKLHMDEGTGVRKHPILQVSWSPVFQPYYMLWSCLPHSAYKQFHQGYELGNPVVDSLLHHFTTMARSVYFDGIQIGSHKFWLVWIAAEGDLPALSKCFHCKRNFGREPNECCFWCEAHDRTEGMAFSNFRVSAEWRDTIGQSRPWSVPGVLCDIPGADHEAFLSKDVFHIIHLGIGRTLAVSFIAYLVDAKYFGAGSVDDRLPRAYADFKTFCTKALQETPHVKAFSKENMGWPSLSYFPECSWKGSDTRLLLRWLIDFCDRPFAHTDVVLRARSACESLDASLRLMYTCDRTFLDAADARRLSQLIKSFCSEYMHSAQLCYNQSRLFFNITPKLHYCFHLSLDLDKQLSPSDSSAARVLNPAMHGTQQAETFIGVASAISRSVHPNSVSRRVAHKFLIQARLDLKGKLP